jgi:receptor protein-tyrosine kinase
MSMVERALAKAAALGRAATGESGDRAARRSAAVPPPSTESRDEATKYLELRTDLLREGGLWVPRGSESRLAEELRVIKRPLLINAESASHVENGQLLMMASALPGAGKTFLAFHLARSMASELDWKVLLIDADISRPTLSRSLGLGDAPGLVSLLEQERAVLSDHVYKTNYSNLAFLPAGPQQSSAKDLLGSQRVRALLADLVTRNPRQMVVFDSPPLLLTSEARVLASYVGQILLIVDAGGTARRPVLDAIELLDPGKAINLVLNKSSRMIGVGDYYYASYGYGTRERESETGIEG